MKIGLALLIILGIGLGSYLFYNSSLKNVPGSSKVEEKIDYKASFIIFTKGALRDFSDPKYHNRAEDAFIETSNPTQVIVRKKGITWNDFFKTLPPPMRLTPNCLTTGTGQNFCTNASDSLKFYLNGERDNNLLSKEIKDGDKILITYGSEGEQEIQSQLNLLK